MLAALATDEDATGAPSLSQFDAISIVSKGGYAALFLISKLVEDAQPSQYLEIANYFSDCIPAAYQNKDAAGISISKTNRLRISSQLDASLGHVH